MVKALARGSLKGVTFESGGGFKVNFGGDGVFQYHPEKKSHHGGAYYKISTGKGGTKRYDLEGNEIEGLEDETNHTVAVLGCLRFAEVLDEGTVQIIFPRVVTIQNTQYIE